MAVGWLKNGLNESNKPKNTVIGELKKNLGGLQEGRDRDVLHASDVTKDHFCPREWALMDIAHDKPNNQWVNMSLDVTFRIGSETERLMVEDWLDQSIVGNWKCRFCGEQRTMVTKPSGFCKDQARRHWWEYVQFRVHSEKYGISGGIDALVKLGDNRLTIVELKILAADAFDKIVAPLPEHRIRTNLYMKVVEESDSPFKNLIATDEARVVYVSRGYGRKNGVWDEVMPFVEFAIKRDDADLKTYLQRAVALKVFRETGKMPQGICTTALDPAAKNSCCKVKECFSGQHPAQIAIGAMEV